jgi:hypothetical protein
MTPKNQKEQKQLNKEILLAMRDLGEQTLADYYRKKENIMYKQQTISQCEKENS